MYMIIFLFNLFIFPCFYLKTLISKNKSEVQLLEFFQFIILGETPEGLKGMLFTFAFNEMVGFSMR